MIAVMLLNSSLFVICLRHLVDIRNLVVLLDLISCCIFPLAAWSLLLLAEHSVVTDHPDASLYHNTSVLL